MTLFEFFNQIAPTYLENAVPQTIFNPTTAKEEPVKMPYVTINYNYVDDFLDTMVQGRIWTKSTSRRKVNELNDNLIDIIGKGITIPVKNEIGTLYLKAGNPISEPYIGDDLTIQANYFTITMNILI